MHLSYLQIRNHPILQNIDLNLLNPKTKKPYSIIAFVGENGCGKTTLLNEIFNYEDSSYITEKEKDDEMREVSHKALYLRQGSLHRNATKEITKLISGKDIYSAYNTHNHEETTKTRSALTELEEGLKLLEKLGDEEIARVFKEQKIGEVYCSNTVSKLIDGKERGYDITKFSSGQQEVLLKLKDISNLFADTDCVLLDEPETSLHPRWQKEILNLLVLLMTDSNNTFPQLFLATHSEKVLESIIGRKDTLIVRLYKENGVIKHQNIEQMNLSLPSPTFAELDFVIFHIPSMEYHDQLLNRVADLFNVETISSIDKIIRQNDFYDKKEYGKVWIDTTKSNNNKYRTLPVYIRNYFHHPKEGLAPKEDEIIKSIKLLKKIIKIKIEE